MITILQPIWLLFAIPLAVSLWLWRFPSRLLKGLRLASLLLILLAMSGLAVILPSRAGTIVVVADRSRSMPPDSEAAQREAIDFIQGAKSTEDRLAVVSFGYHAVIELTPESGQFAGFVGQVGQEASNLAEAVDKALSLIPQDGQGRILVLSDGQWTGKNPISVASRAAARGVAIDYRALRRSLAGDVAISRIDAPNTVTPGEAFMITAWLRSPIQQEVTFELRRGLKRLALGRRTVSSGLNRLTFRDQAVKPGTQGYRLRVVGSDQDPVPENNTARALVGVRGPRSILCVTTTPDAGLARLLQAGGMNVKVAKPETVNWSIEDLSNYSALLIENEPAQKIGVRGMEMIAAWVREAGAGLMMTGGKNAYGPGGYFRSPLDEVMPVSMELRREHRELSLAIVVAMDRSGSMAAAAGGGRTKMDLANIAAVEVLDLLSPLDEFGALAVDSSSHIIADLASVQENQRARGAILSIDSQGGGIFVYEALSSASDMLLSAASGTRHIILFADAADSEESGKYKELLETCKRANITVSVIGLGQPTDQDADLLRDIARRGEGQIFFTDDPEELPRLFAQDTFVVARSTFIKEPTTIQSTGGLVTLTGRRFDAPPAIGGYNLCYIRPGANLATVTVDEYNAPVVASWQAGVGRVLCYTGEADGEFTGPIAGWKDGGNFFTSLARWTAGETQDLPGNMLLTQEVNNGIAVVRLHLDPERKTEPFAEVPTVTTLRGVAGRKPEAEKTRMHWTSADTLAVEIRLRGAETALSTVDVPGVGPVSLSPVTLPYSPEFEPVEADEGLLTLERLAKASGGKERVNLSDIWKDLPPQPRLVELAPWLLMAALILLLLEVLERRTRLLSARRLPLLSPGRQPAPGKKRAVPKRPRPAVAEPASAPMATEETAPPPAEDEAPEMLDALRQARRRARQRTRR